MMPRYGGQKIIQMREEINQAYPKRYKDIQTATEVAGFSMASDVLTCSFLRTLAASKPSGKFLELGTGTGLATSWILGGMDERSTLISIDNDPIVVAIAREKLAFDGRVAIVLIDGEKWIKENGTEKFDYIFADTWHGKYLLLEETLTRS